ncbi:MAG: Rap1a/Tai family immunity protein [Geminicoccaceae bacterium]
MRRHIIILASLALLGPLCGRAYALDPSVYQLRTAADLIAICSAQGADPDHDVARAMCAGYVQGGLDLHDVVAAVPAIGPLACPPATTPVGKIIDAFLGFAAKHPQIGTEKPIDALIEAAAATWPCGKAG